MSSMPESHETASSSSSVLDAGESSQPASQPPPAEYPGVAIDPSRQIRVLTLEPGEYGSPIQCQLSVVTLKLFGQWLDPAVEKWHNACNRYNAFRSVRPCGPTMEELPLGHRNEEPASYEALSYTWGSWEQHQWIVLHGLHFPVTKTLWEALQRLRRQSTARRLWIDQLCINQSSVAERNQQVRMMGKVYQCSERAIVWLGDLGEEVSHQILALVRPRIGEPITLTRSANLEGSEEKAIEIALNSVAARPSPHWWERAWVIQESVKAPDFPTFVCGPFEIDFHSIWAVAADVVCRYLFDNRRFPSNNLNVFQQFLQDIQEIRSRHAVSGLDVVRLANVWTTTYSTDPRDKVYALLNLLPGRERTRIIPDYESAVSSVFTEATYASMISGSFRILTHVVADPVWRLPDLPSWTVDFQITKPYRSGIPDVPTYDVSTIGQAEDKLRFLDFECPEFDHQNLHLIIKGSEFEKVAAILPIMLLPGRHRFELESNGFMLPTKLENDYIFDRDEKKLLIESIQALASSNCCHDFVFGQLDEESSLARKSVLKKTTDRLRWSLSRDILTSIPVPVASLFRNWFEALDNDAMTALEGRIGVSKYYLMPWDTWNAYFSYVSNSASALFVTERGFIGICPGHVQEEDQVALLCGMPAPVILRRNPKIETAVQRVDAPGLYQESAADLPQTWSFQGFSFVNGLMGEDCLFNRYLDSLRQRAQKFVLA